MSNEVNPDPTEAALLHARCVPGLLTMLAIPQGVHQALDNLSALMKRGRADYEAVCALDSELIPLRAAAGRPAIAIGPRDCPTAHRAGVEATWILEKMVRNALISAEVCIKDRQRWLANAGLKEPFDYQFAKDFSDVIVCAASQWELPMRGLAVEITYEHALLWKSRQKNTSEQPEPADVTGRNKPVWDRAKRRLTIGTEKIEVAQREAPAQFAVLDLLEKAGWPTHGVEVPKSIHGLKDAVDALNSKLAPTHLRITRHENNTRVGWSRINS